MAYLPAVQTLHTLVATAGRAGGGGGPMMGIICGGSGAVGAVGLGAVGIAAVGLPPGGGLGAGGGGGRLPLCNERS